MIRLLLFFSLLIFLIPIYAQEEEQIVFGKKVRHPHVWMKNATSGKLQEWLALEANRTSKYFAKSDFKKLNSVLYAPRNSYVKDGIRFKFTLVTGGKIPPKLKYYERGGVNKGGLLIKCSDFKLNENDFPSIERYWVADSELFLVAAISHSGQDWLEYKIYDLETKQEIGSLQGIIRPEVIFQGKGFYYERFDPPSTIESVRTNQRISFHEFYTDQSRDRDVFVNADPSSIRYFTYSRIEKSRFVYVNHPVKIKGVWKRALTKLELGDLSPLKPFLIFSSPHRITFDMIRQEEDTVFIRTDLRDPNYEILKFNTSQTNRFLSFIPPNELVLKDMTYLNDEYFGLKYLSEGRYLGVIVDRNGEVKKQFRAADGGSITFVRESDDMAYCLHHYYLFGINYDEINLKTMKSKFIVRNKFNPAYEWNASKYAKTELVSYKNNDGEEVPMTILYNSKTFRKEGDQPTLIKVYGGYGTDQEPVFNWENFLFVKNGGVLAIPGVRGSSARGASWALAGRGINKQNTIDDVIAAAEYLIKKKYVKRKRIFLEGGSHGGFLVAASAIQRPQLFGGVIASAGVFDLVNFTNQSVGNLEPNRTEFGDPSDSLTFLSRYDISPIQNLEKGVNYPSFLILAGSNDTRVSPTQSYRFLRELKRKSRNARNFLHVTDGGHNIAQYPNERLEIMSLKFKFLWLHTGYKFWKG